MLTRTVLFALLSTFAGLTAAQPVAQPASSQPGSTQPALRIVSREQWGSRPEPIPESRKQTPKIFTIHHAGELWVAGTDPAVALRKLQSFGQREKHWPDLPYHYIIAPDGTVYEGRDWHYQPESNTKYDLSGVLNIELLGNFEEQRVSIEQLRALVALLSKLSTDLHIDPSTIRGHKDAAEGQTVCPGRDLYRYIHEGLVRRWVEDSLAGHEADVHELPELSDGPTTRISTSQPADEAAN